LNQHHSHLWRIDCQNQQTQTDDPNPSAVHHIIETSSWCNIIPCATNRHYKHVIFPYPFMSGFQRLFINLCNGIGEREKCFPSRSPSARSIDHLGNKAEEKGEEYVHSNVHWTAILAFASLFSLLQTHDTRKANTQPPIVLL
jgi:hypothetical protein